MKKASKKTTTKSRGQYPYIVFQVEKGLRERLRRKTQQLRKQGKPGGSMSEFVELLIKKAV